MFSHSSPVPGAVNLVRAPHIAHDMYRLGCPHYFMVILAARKLLGAIAIVVPGFARFKELAYAGMISDLTGSAISRLAIGDDALSIVIPLAIVAVVLASWALRPPSRRLSEGCSISADACAAEATLSS